MILFKNVNMSYLRAPSVHRILFLAYSFIHTTPLADSGVIVPNYLHSCPFLLLVYIVRCSGELYLVSYVCLVVDCYNLCYLNRDVCCCGITAAVGHTVLYAVCIALL
jgi:hypothetical protein